MSRVTNAIAIAAKGAALGKNAETIKFCSTALNESPNNVPLLTILGQCLLAEDRYMEALLALERVVEINPEADGVWFAIAKCYAELAPFDPPLYDKMKEAAKRGIKINPDDCTGYMTLSYGGLQDCDYQAAFDNAKEALKIESRSKGSKYNMAAPFLFNHMWEEGWHCFDASLTARFQHGVPDYGVPLWKGEPGKVIIAAEQGLGDEMMFASMIPSVQKDADIIIDTCEPLAGLFERSFGVETHGTRYDDDATWKRENRADFWFPMGSLGAMYRAKHEDFPGTPYLKADPERRTQWRALLESFSDKPKIGIAWSGGIEKTNKRFRSLSLRDIAPILEYDVEWVSLQYKDTNDIPDYIHHWQRAASGKDYDETAALIAELDIFITVTTAAVHCAGGLGTKTWCLVPERPQWRYGRDGDRMVWYDSVELLRQEDGVWPIAEICRRLSAMGIEKCRDNSPRTKITILPQNNTPNWLPPLSRNAGLTKYLITGLDRAA